MTRLAHFLVALCVLVLLSGCTGDTRRPRATTLLLYPHAMHAKVAQSGHEHFQTVSNVAHRDRRALVDDLDMLFMTDRPTRLTRWHDR